MNTQNNKKQFCRYFCSGSFLKSMIINVEGVEVYLVKKSVKNLSIRINREKRVTLTFPKTMPKEKAISFFKQKIDWVKDKLASIKGGFNFKDGEKFYFLGKQLGLRVVLGKNSKYLFTDGELVIFAKDENSVKSRFEKAVREEFFKTAEKVVDFWAKTTGLGYNKLSVRKTVSVWGSCNSTTGNINLSVYLAFMPENSLNYVALHEVCHLRHQNHGEGFKNMLNYYMPDWRKERKFLNESYKEFIVVL